MTSNLMTNVSEGGKKNRTSGIDSSQCFLDDLTADLSDAIEKLSAVGITVRAATLEEAREVCERDVHYVYSNMSVLSLEYGGPPKVLMIEYEGVPCGFAAFGVFEKAGQKFGEVGMLHVSPAARSKGFMRLLALLSQKSLVDDSDVLFSAVADKTGAVESFLTSLGCKNTGGLTSGVVGYPIWQLNVDDPAALKAKMNVFFVKQAEWTVAAVSVAPLSVEALDKDNVFRESTSVRDSVEEVYSSAGFGNRRALHYFFGRWGGPISIRKCAPNASRATPILVLSVSAGFLDVGHARAILDEQQDLDFDVDVKPNGPTTDYVASFFYSRPEDGYHKLQGLAVIGDVIAERMRREAD